jgi:hypothetical protein
MVLTLVVGIEEPVTMVTDAGSEMIELETGMPTEVAAIEVNSLVIGCAKGLCRCHKLEISPLE